MTLSESGLQDHFWTVSKVVLKLLAVLGISDVHILRQLFKSVKEVLISDFLAVYLKLAFQISWDFLPNSYYNLQVC